MGIVQTPKTDDGKKQAKRVHSINETRNSKPKVELIHRVPAICNIIFGIAAG
jgi:hypothetical protein